MRRTVICLLMVAAVLVVTACAESQLEKTFTDLEKVGIEVSERARQEILHSIEETLQMIPEDIRQEWGFDSDYYSDYFNVLIYLGMGEFNEADGSYSPYSDSVFAFDAEAYDLTYSYMSLLEALERMSGEEMKVDGVEVKITDELYLAGQGIFDIDFCINDQSYTYQARMDFDWLDVGLINYLNGILEDHQAKGRLLSYSDGQIVILFYNTPAWAKEFAHVTGMTLQTEI